MHLLTDPDQNEDVALFVTDGDSMLLPSVRDGSPITQEDEAIVDASLQREGIEIGDRLVFGEESELTVVGFTDSQRYSHTPVVFVDGGGRETINAIAISVDESRADEIRNAVGNSFDMVTKDEALKGIPSYSQEQASLNMMIVFLFVITAFVLAAFFYVITLQKRDQFGVLKALGAKTTYLAQNLVGQVVLISIMCIGIAMGLTLGIAELLPEEMPFLLTADEMVQTSILILIVSIIGAFLSLIQIVKIDPIEAIEGLANDNRYGECIKGISRWSEVLYSIGLHFFGSEGRRVSCDYRSFWIWKKHDVINSGSPLIANERNGFA